MFGVEQRGVVDTVRERKTMKQKAVVLVTTTSHTLRVARVYFCGECLTTPNEDSQRRRSGGFCFSGLAVIIELCGEDTWKTQRKGSWAAATE